MTAEAFATLQRKLGPALAANRAGSTTPHVLIAMDREPSPAWPEAAADA